MRHKPGSFKPITLSRIANRYIRDVAEEATRDRLTALAEHIALLEEFARQHGAQGINATITVRF